MLGSLKTGTGVWLSWQSACLIWARSPGFHRSASFTGCDDVWPHWWCTPGCDDIRPHWLCSPGCDDIWLHWWYDPGCDDIWPHWWCNPRCDDYDHTYDTTLDVMTYDHTDDITLGVMACDHNDDITPVFGRYRQKNQQSKAIFYYIAIWRPALETWNLALK